MFDILVLIVLATSAIVGLARGATRELVGILSFLLAVVIAVFTLKFTAPAALEVIKTVWLAKALALLAVFVVAYVVLRILGGVLAGGVPKSAAGPLDRVLGLGFGIIRALVLLGVFNIVLRAAMPVDKTPDWVANARLYPLTQLSADALQALAPQGQKVADQVKPALQDAIDGPQAGAAKAK